MESSVMLGSISFFIQPHTSAVAVWLMTSRGRRSNPELTYITALRRFSCDGDAPRHWRMPMWGGFLRWGWQSEGDGNRRRVVV